MLKFVNALQSLVYQTLTNAALRLTSNFYLLTNNYAALFVNYERL